MSNPTDVKYHEAHTWIKAEAGGVYRVGITHHAQEQLGDVVFVEPPKVGASVKQSEACGVVESVKTAADIHAPASGVVLAINPALEATPELLNTEPYTTWLFTMTLTDAGELTALLDAAAYEQVVA